MSKLNFTVDTAKCTRCGLCAEVCTGGIIKQNDGGSPFVEEDECLECQQCFAICPAGALSIFGVTVDKVAALTTDKLPSYPQMQLYIRGRRTTRQYDKVSIETAVIDELLTDLSYSPTGCNDRELTFAYVNGRDGMEKLLNKIVTALQQKAAAGGEVQPHLLEAASLFRENGVDAIFRGAPHLLLVYPTPDKVAHCGNEDTIIALSYFELLANRRGLGTTWCGLLTFILEAVPELRAEFGLPPSGYFYTMLFGKPNVKYVRTVSRDSCAVKRQIAVT
jgi:NAD-dependent dihydropyrimidine dehydrogenase PreA subunit/nitroreductase